MGKDKILPTGRFCEEILLRREKGKVCPGVIRGFELPPSLIFRVIAITETRVSRRCTAHTHYPDSISTPLRSLSCCARPTLQTKLDPRPSRVFWYVGPRSVNAGTTCTFLLPSQCRLPFPWPVVHALLMPCQKRLMQAIIAPFTVHSLSLCRVTAL